MENAFIRGLGAWTVVHPEDETGDALDRAEEKEDPRPHFHVHERLDPASVADGLKQREESGTGFQPIENFIKHNGSSLIFKI